MNISTQFHKFDRKYLFLEYHLTHCLPIQRNSNRNFTKKTDISIKTQTLSVDSTEPNSRSENKNVDFKIVALYLQFVESTIAKDFILLHHIWSFFKLYSKPKLFKLFPNRRSFLCYWIFPFVGFITISNLNTDLEKPLSLLDSYTQPFRSKTVLQTHSSITWENLEYLNYKQLFLKNNTLNNKLQKKLIQTSNIKLEHVYNITDSFLLNSSKNKNFYENQINNIVTTCNSYLTQTADSIYSNTVTNKFGYDTVKMNNFSETLLGNQFTSNTVLESYWYGLNFLNISKTQTNWNSALNSNTIENSQISHNFPDKLLSVCSKKLFLTDFNSINSLNRDTDEFMRVHSDTKQLFNFQDIINLNFKETELIPNVVKQFKNKLRLYEKLPPILFYQKAYILLTNLIEKFEIDFSVDLKT